MNVEQISKIVEDNKEKAIQFLVDAVQIPSVSGDELNISKFFHQKFDEMGLNTEVHALDETRPNLISTWKSAEGPTFVFNGHYDVFPPVASDPGKYGPWAGKIVDGCLYGRGSVDMKGGLCAAVMAVDFLKQSGFEPKGSVVISCDVDEELGGKYGVEYLLDQGLLNYDFGVCMEPTQGMVHIEGGGGLFLKVTYTSETWHGGVQRNGWVDALQKAIIAAQKLYELDDKIRKEKYYEPFDGGAFLSITEFNAGEAMNVHPSKCSFTIDRRLVPGETPESVKEEICNALESLKNDKVDMSYEVEVLSRMPALIADPDAPLVHSALAAYKAVYGKEGKLYKRPGGSDNAKMAEKYGYCIPNFGPGHDVVETTSPNEHLPIQEYLDFIKIYMLMVIDMLGEK